MRVTTFSPALSICGHPVRREVIDQDNNGHENKGQEIKERDLMSSQEQTEAMQMPPPAVVTDEHRWLQQLVGNWTYAMESVSPECGGDGGTGTQTIRMLGDLWLLAEAEGPAGDEMMRSIITLGYDPEKKKFIGSFIASMMTHFWPYEGSLDADGKTLRLASQGPRFDGAPGPGIYEDVIEKVSDNEYLLRGRFKLDDGSFNEFMVSRYTRTK